MIYQLSYWNLVSIMFFCRGTTYTELVKPYNQYNMVVLDLLIIKPRVNIYLSQWTVLR